ncbi:hypothetical protein JNUCC0626_30225 [Lentzea sp. JNUCC 0626]|uniref:hypothetical protein n=1 Tax=Lentzea sp. JNUCC 0626 TaxID=3367513 RepID=UPI003747E463
MSQERSDCVFRACFEVAAGDVAGFVGRQESHGPDVVERLQGTPDGCIGSIRSAFGNLGDRQPCREAVQKFAEDVPLESESLR